jgi:uncharacterized phage protein (TIGR02218 family)
MSKTIGSSLLAHLQGRVTTIATCWHIERLDGRHFYFTDHDCDLKVDGHTFLAGAGMFPSAVAADRSLSADNLEVVCFINSDSLEESDIVAGRFDGASVDVFQVNWADTSMGKIYLAKGWTFGNVKSQDNSFTVEIQGKAKKLEQSIVQLYSPTCRAEFCDSRCGLSPGDHTVSGEVVAINEQGMVFESSVKPQHGYWDGGILTWEDPSTTGSACYNAGLSLPIVAGSPTGIITLFRPTPFAISEGDTFTVLVGCDKRMSTCHTRFANEINFRGEPYVTVEGELDMKRMPDRDGRNAWSR